MKKTLNQTQIKILDLIQQPLPIRRQPFEKPAWDLGIPQEELLAELENLKNQGFIRRFRPQINYRALGRVATLVASSVSKEKIADLTDALNNLPGVSHNYLRDHSFNIWFTLQAQSAEAINDILTSLKNRLALEFLDFPSAKTFKLDVRFNPAGPGAAGLFARCSQIAPVYDNPADLTDREKRLLPYLNQDIPFVSAPFDDIARQIGQDSVQQLLDDLQSLCGRGVIRRIAAVLDYRKLGYNANAMLCLNAGNDALSTAGNDLAQFIIVSHCYQRQTRPDWPYNLYAMLHAATSHDLRTFAKSFAHRHHITEHILLPTVRELKKSPVPFDY